MNKNVVVFDVDKTLVFGDLHSIVIDRWLSRNQHYRALHRLTQLLHSFALIPHFKRRIEYLFTAFIPVGEMATIIHDLMEDDSVANRKLFQRIAKYKRSNTPIFLVSAAPERIIKVLADILEVNVIASKTISGVLIRDYLAKKIKAYETLAARGLTIRTIYSDSKLDFMDKAKNILITDRAMTLQQYLRATVPNAGAGA